MRTIHGSGCWKVEVEGSIAWRKETLPILDTTVGDRAAEILRFRAALGQAMVDVEAWSEQQPTVEARLLLQGYKEAMAEGAWILRACALIDKDGLPGSLAATEAATQIGMVMATRSPQLKDRATHLADVAQWIAQRLAPAPDYPHTIMAAVDLNPLQVLDLDRPALIGGPEPIVRGNQGLVWGIRDLSPEWAGRRVAINGTEITLDVAAPQHWSLTAHQLGGHPICYLNGDLEAVGRMARKVSRPPAVMVRRLEDLAAVPLFIKQAAVVAIDLDRLSRGHSLRHPGVELLVKAALQAALESGVPLLVGGNHATKQPDMWLAKGVTAVF